MAIHRKAALGGLISQRRALAAANITGSLCDYTGNCLLCTATVAAGSLSPGPELLVHVPTELINLST